MKLCADSWHLIKCYRKWVVWRNTQITLLQQTRVHLSTHSWKAPRKNASHRPVTNCRNVETCRRPFIHLNSNKKCHTFALPFSLPPHTDISWWLAALLHSPRGKILWEKMTTVFTSTQSVRKNIRLLENREIGSFLPCSKQLYPGKVLLCLESIGIHIPINNIQLCWLLF